MTDGTNTLVIDTAQMVLRDIKFHMVGDSDLLRFRARTEDPATTTAAITVARQAVADGDRSMLHDDDGNDDDCDELRIGPYLLDLPLDDGAGAQLHRRRFRPAHTAK